MRRTEAACLAVLLLAAHGAEGRSFRLGRWTGFTELGFDFQEQDQVSVAGARPLFERSVTEERLGLRNTATVVSPRFLTINFGLSLGLLQSQLTADRERVESGEGRLNGFDLNATFMPMKPYGFTLLSSRLENVTPVEFAGSRRLQTSQLGLSMQVGPRFFPASLTYRDIELESTADLGRDIRGLDQQTRTLTYRGENRWQRHELYAFVQLQEVDDRVARGFSNRSQTASVNHTAELLAPKLATLRSNLRYFDRRGPLTAASFHFDQELRLRHSDSLSSGLRYELRNLESASAAATDGAQQSAWVRHELWSSLDTDLRLTRSSLTSAAGRTDHDQAMLQIDYRKDLPAGGKLHGRISAFREWRDNQRSDGQELVTRESHSVRFGVAARLELPRVTPGSVVVSDELGTTLYEEGVDYELQVIGEFTEILPLPGGRIRDGQIVLVDYRVESPAMNRSTSRRESYDLTVDYGWFAPFFGYQRSVDELVAGQPSTLFDDRRESYAGLRLRADRPRLRFVSYNEIRSRDSRLMAFESLRLADGLSFSPTPHWTVSANAVHLETRFELPLRDVRVDDGRLSVRWRPLPSLSLEAYGGWREVRDTLAADQTFDRLGFESRWNLGKISVIGSVEHWQRRRNGQDLDGTRAALTISRRFYPGKVASARRRPPPEPWPADLPGLVPSPPHEEQVWAGAPPPAAAAPEPDGGSALRD
jgi:hypothetical protein